ncbi:MAG: aminotransferase class I/II-fold pyridoxal phosphate-dependent enzyme [Alphaproteobacteria bacterium]|nr:aminotransferase class I/II-fold pyridoxal phosphate-dependent enzyme [Alphaproteobacteria bacterium]
MSKSKHDIQDYALSTQLVHGGRLMSPWGETSEALFLNSSYSYESAEAGEARFDGSNPGFKYGRYSHPNLSMVEARLALLEGASGCVVTASGMAALFAALMCQLRAGDHVAASAVLFSSCHYIITQILPRFGISITLVEGDDEAGWKNAITAKTKCVFVETPANPTLTLVDIAFVAGLCKKAGAQLIVDNVFATAMAQKPLALGADVVMVSTTKHLDGQGRTLGGAIMSNDTKWLEETLAPFCRHTGPHMSQFNAWLLLKSLETFELRMARHLANAKAIAELLDSHKAVEKLYYPGLPSHKQHALAKKQMSHGGPMLAVELKGGKQAAFAFMNKLKIFDISNNLGNAKSLATHPASTTHASIGAEERAKIGITDGLIRLSPGIEDTADLVADIAQAL